MHLNDEQFEDALGPDPPRAVAEHLSACEKCRQTLAERMAIRARLQRAFAAVHAPAGLADRIRAQSPSATGTRHMSLSFRRRVWPILAAATAVLVMALPLAVYLAGPSLAQAAQQELVDIHRNNLTDGHDFSSEYEPDKLAAYFRDKLGFVPAMPRLNRGMALRGCCVAHFRDQVVGSYVVNTPRGVISIIAVKDKPEAMGMKAWSTGAGRNFYSGAFGANSLAAVRMGDFTYCAVGEVPAESLVELLSLLVAGDAS